MYFIYIIVVLTKIYDKYAVLRNNECALKGRTSS